MPELPPGRPEGATIFERHAEVWRFLAVILPAVFAGSLAGDLAETHDVPGPARLAIALVVAFVLAVLLVQIWNRVVAWLAARQGSPPTV